MNIAEIRRRLALHLHRLADTIYGSNSMYATRIGTINATRITGTIKATDITSITVGTFKGYISPVDDPDYRGEDIYN